MARMGRLSVACMLSLLGSVGVAAADCEDVLENLVSYTIIASKTIDGWRDKSGADDEDGDHTSFEGCDYDRVIKFTDGTTLRCAEYGYMYAYRPTAVIFAKKIESPGRSLTVFKMLVEDTVYDMRR
jgi:hypothetical protein